MPPTPAAAAAAAPAAAVTDACEARAASAGVEDDLGWALVTVLRAYGQAAERALAGLPGGVRGYRLLSSVTTDCPRSQLALAQHVGLDRTVVTYLLDDLAADGLLDRQPDPTDRRARRIVATESGRARLRAVGAALEEAEQHLLGGLSAAEATVLRELLQRVALGVGAPGPGGIDDPGACPSE